METRASSQETGKTASWTLDLQQALAEVIRLPRTEIPPAEIPAVLSRLAAAQSALTAAQGALVMRIATFPSAQDGNGSGKDEDRWLTSDEAASLLRVDRKWLYRRARGLPFCRRLSRKKDAVLGSRNSPLDGDENTLKKEGS